MRVKVIYHKNCIDGLASAFIVKKFLEKEKNIRIKQFIPIQYGEENTIFDDDISKDDIYYFVDFSLKRDLMLELSKSAGIIIVIDHHKTAEQELKDIKKEASNIFVHFDMEKSGATLCYKHLTSNLKAEIFDYIGDRDLWNWELPFSKEINEAIRFKIKQNSLESFEEVYNKFDFLEFASFGKILLQQKDLQVQSKIKRVKDIIFHGISFKCLNATENISEIGNAICTTYNTPALLYFITEKDEVVCSLRSIDTLEDVSVVAKSLGGGGHRNACGFTTDIENLSFILNSKE